MQLASIHVWYKCLYWLNVTIKMHIMVYKFWFSYLLFIIRLLFKIGICMWIIPFEHNVAYFGARLAGLERFHSACEIICLQSVVYVYIIITLVNMFQLFSYWRLQTLTICDMLRHIVDCRYNYVLSQSLKSNLFDWERFALLPFTFVNCPE